MNKFKTLILEYAKLTFEKDINNIKNIDNILDDLELEKQNVN